MNTIFPNNTPLGPPSTTLGGGFTLTEQSVRQFEGVIEPSWDNIQGIPADLIPSSRIRVNEISDATEIQDESGAALTVGAGRAVGKLVDSGGAVLNLKDYVVGDGVADDSAGFLAAVADAKILKVRLFGPADLTIRITAAASLVGILHAQIESKIVVDWTAASGAYITAGSNAASLTPCRLYFREVTTPTGSTPALPVLRLVGLKRGDVTVDSCPYVQLYADANDATVSSIGYSHFKWGKVDTLELYGGPGAWINENLHLGGRFRHVLIGTAGGYSHNQNTFLKPCIEGVSELHILSGTNNHFLNVRSENGLAITFDAGTYHNVVQDAFVSNQDVISGSAASVTDNGTENVYISPIEQAMDRVAVMALTRNSKVYDASSEYVGASAPSATPTFAGMVAAGANADQINVVVPVDEVKRWLISSDAAIWRPYIYCLDANGVLLDANSGSYIRSFGGWVPNVSGFYTFNADVAGAALIFSSEVKYARIRIRCPNGGSFTHLSLEAFLTKNVRHTALARIVDAIHAPPYQTTKPTRGFSRKGDVVTKSGGVWTCTATSEVALASTAGSGATILSVTSGAGIANGDIIAVELDSGTTQWTAVSSGGGTTSITIALALAGAASAGKRIFTARWV